jgi:hypothetical protein
MKEYIEREALIKKIFPIGVIDDGRYAIPAKAVKIAIDNAPAADMVEVVRCRHCKHFCPYEGEEHKGDCAELVGLESCVYEDDYCSYGERKEK